MSHTDPPPESGAIVHTKSEVEEDLEVSRWLLGATESRDRSRMEWQERGVTMLPTGGIFSAIRMSARLIHAAACSSDVDAVDSYLERALVGGPVIHDPARCRYYALVPTRDGRPWEVTRDLEPLGLGSYVIVPRPGLTAVDAGSGAPYWSVPMESAGTLCVPAAVAALVEIARYELATQAPGTDALVSPLPRERRR